MKTKLIILATTLYLQIIVCSITSAQGVLISSSAGTPDASAGLEVNFTDKGMLIPRVALTSNNSASPVTSPADYLLVYNTATAGSAPNDVVPGFYYWKTDTWIPIAGKATSSGDMQYWDGSKWVTVSVGSQDQLLKLTTGALVPTWSAAPSPTPPSPSPAVNPPAIDGDGNIYSTVTIGNQTWMTENLKTTKYNDGTNISIAATSDDWVSYGADSNSPIGGVTAYNFDNSNGGTYGGLYNFVAVVYGKLCPIGWHVPTESDWLALGTYLSDNHSGQWTGTSAYHLKESGTAHWNPNVHGDNSTGFGALPGGKCDESANFYDIDNNAYFWSSTFDNPGLTYFDYFHLDSEQGTGSDNYLREDSDANPFWGMSVRCIYTQP